MKNVLTIAIVALGMALAATDADAARRFGGGGNLGKQRAIPSQQQAAPASPASPTQAAPAKPAQPSATPTTPPPKPSFMQRWGGLLAGLGIGALLASLFGAQLGPIVGMLLMGLLVFGAILLLMRLFGARKSPAALGSSSTPSGNRPSFAGIGSAVPGNAERSGTVTSGTSERPTLRAVETPAAIPAGFEVEPFLRVAKTSFIRLQAANDARDLDDIRDYTTPEMYAELAMQVRDRGEAPQRTEVVSLEAKLLEVATEGDYQVASVRFWGLIREEAGANPEPFDEVWHVRKDLRERNGAWLISGIQQMPQ